MKKIIVFSILIITFYVVFIKFINDNNILDNITENDTLSAKVNNNYLKNISKVLTYKNSNNIFYMLKGKEYNLKPLNISDEPIIYIYNTHDKESYNNSSFTVYNVSLALQNMLKEYGITSLVEDISPTDLVKKYNEDYPSTYTHSKENLINAKNKYPSLKYFIDLHRDGVSKEVSTVTINGISYAKLMFFLGMNHKDSDKNYALVKSLEEIIDKKYEGILRKTFIREDDDYNQDVSPNSFLIEVGGNYNTINEVYNSLKVLSYAIYTFLEGNS